MEDNASPEKWYILTRLRRAAHCWRHNLTTSEEFLPTPKMLDEAADEIEQLYNQSISPKIEHLPGTSALKIAINQIEEELDGIRARIFQHEFDHLNGILFIDRLNPLKRKLLARKLNKIVNS